MPASDKKILFFSGGSALRALCPALLPYSHNTFHIITTFDSGGSSAIIRRAFAMPAVGDLRNRLMALADRRQKGHQDVLRLFAYRLDKHKKQSILLEELRLMAHGRHPLAIPIPREMKSSISHHLQFFLQIMPEDFSLQGANIGNLILTAGYLENGRKFDPVLSDYSRLAQVRGEVRPIANQDLHLAAKLENGQLIIGQHLITGKEYPPVSSKIEEIFLTPCWPEEPFWQSALKDIPQDHVQSRRAGTSCAIEHIRPEEIIVDSKTLSLIPRADLICYPMGSFYSSLVVNLLPRKIQKAISRSTVPKVFIPNTFPDPEQFATKTMDWIWTLGHYLMAGKTRLDQVLNIVLLDHDLTRYPGGIDRTVLRQAGLEVMSYPLVSLKSRPAIDPELLAQALFSL